MLHQTRFDNPRMTNSNDITYTNHITKIYKI